VNPEKRGYGEELGVMEGGETVVSMYCMREEIFSTKKKTRQDKTGKERKGKERKGKERKGKERKGKERKNFVVS
jgi:prophage tail gpP-like protein